MSRYRWLTGAYAALCSTVLLGCHSSSLQVSEEEVHPYGPSLVVSPDGRHIAYLAGPRHDRDLDEKRSPSQLVPILDGKPLPAGQGPERAVLVFSADSRHLAYAIGEGNKFAVVVDGHIGASWDLITRGPTFSSDGDHLAYTVVEARKSRMVLDGQLLPDSGLVPGYFWFVNQPAQLAYAVSRPSGVAIIVGRIRGKTYPYINFSSVQTSDSHGHMAYIAQDGDKHFVVRNGQEVSHDNVVSRTLQLSPDGQHVAYVVATDGRWRVFVDNQEQQGPDFLISGRDAGPLFSADSRHFAYSGSQNTKCCVVLDGTPGALYDTVRCVTFSPDSQRIAYVAEAAGQYFLVIGGDRGPGYEQARRPVFSPDGQHICYEVMQEGRSFVALDRTLHGPYFAVKPETITFSPDSARVAFIGFDSTTEFVVSGWQAGRGYQQINPYSLCFSPDGQHLVYVGKRRGREFVVLDGVEGPAYTYILSQGLPKFVDNNTVKYLAQRGDHTYWVTQKVVD